MNLNISIQLFPVRKHCKIIPSQEKQFNKSFQSQNNYDVKSDFI